MSSSAFVSLYIHLHTCNTCKVIEMTLVDTPKCMTTLISIWLSRTHFRIIQSILSHSRPCHIPALKPATLPCTFLDGFHRTQPAA